MRFPLQGKAFLSYPDGSQENELFAQIEEDDNAKRRFLRICFDLEAAEEKQKYDDLAKKVQIRYLMNKPSNKETVYASIVSHDQIYITEISLSFENCWFDKNDIVFRVNNPIVSTSEVGVFPNLKSLHFSGINFTIESNRNIRRVLLKEYNFDIVYGKYTEKGNQYSRFITVRFDQPKGFDECELIWRTIIQLRTIIDGFQNNEADISLLFEGKEMVYNYLSRRKVDKYRWYQNSRLEVDCEEYVSLINFFFSQFKDPKVASSHQHLMNVCEYLHHPSFSLPTSRFLELITAFEGYAKANLKSANRNSDPTWEQLLKNLTETINNSEYESQMKKKMRKRLHIINPNNERLFQYLCELFKLSLKHLKLVYCTSDYEDLIKDIVSVRNDLAHNPLEYIQGSKLKGDQLIWATCLLREMIIVVLLVGQGDATNPFILRSTNADSLKQEVKSKLKIFDILQQQ